MMDGHVHSEWSWDTPSGSMHDSCAQAAAAGLPAIAFTEHVDHTVWTVALDAIDGNDHLAALATADGKLVPPPLDVAGYLNEIERCRDIFPDLHILTGVELGEPHWHPGATEAILSTGRFDRVLGSLHCLPDRDGFTEPPGLYAHTSAAEVMRAYLTEVVELVTNCPTFSVLAHIDYPVRSWPADKAGPFDPLNFEAEFRHALRVAAQAGKTLEVNTVVPLHSTILSWWCEEGGTSVAFGSDAHEARKVARGLRDAAAMAEAFGFGLGGNPYEFWRSRRNQPNDVSAPRSSKTAPGAQAISQRLPSGSAM